MSEASTKTLAETLAEMALLYPETPQGQDLVVAPAKPSLPASAAKTSSVVASKPPGKTLAECLNSQNQLTILLDQTYATLRKYGEAADVTEARDAMFQRALAGYTLDQVMLGFSRYMERHTEIPTPAEIVGYIDPWKRALCPRMYSKLVHKRKKGYEDGQFRPLSNEEEEFIHRYEEQQFGRY